MQDPNRKEVATSFFMLGLITFTAGAIVFMIIIGARGGEDHALAIYSAIPVYRFLFFVIFVIFSLGPIQTIF